MPPTRAVIAGVHTPPLKTADAYATLQSSLARRSSSPSQIAAAVEAAGVHAGTTDPPELHPQSGPGPVKPYPDVIRGHPEIPGDLRYGLLVQLDPPEHLGVRGANLSERHNDAAARPVMELLRQGPEQLLILGPT
jgi:hypothetical protein